METESAAVLQFADSASLKQISAVESSLKKKKPHEKVLIIVAILLLVVVAVGLFFLDRGPSCSDILRPPAIPEDEYKALCEEISYEALSRSSDSNSSRDVAFLGEVFQVEEETDKYAVCLISVTKNDYGFWTDNIQVIARPNSNTRLLKGDISGVLWETAGLYTYGAVSGASITVPLVAIYYIDLQ